ncbi:CDP-glycerol glycerophosphotransferase family protein [Planomicrobium sp. CPCC 101110]|uniref:CDP-glycerol glycerophosphotransferase family protein n=1 Tax=Planomicrobium sp. CPCC 101110 TaxID=2599619 RepID=UPI0011B61407|nr:CDP-glycerol glycerophosphotransferase family protein [Planomicrobium sp. CPCC 101110]TWT27694.1 ribitolphosphotransferase [Planomicrobium sp. CPCC 101110]
MKAIRKIKYFLFWAFKIVYQSCYRVLSLIVPVNENKILMVVSRSEKLEGNLKFIHDELITQRPDAKIHLISSANKMNLKLFKELFAIAGTKYLILDDFFLPVYLIKPAKTLKVIQLWHAAGAFKKFGYSTVDKTFGPDKGYLKIVPVHSNYTHVYVSSPNVVPHYAEAFNMPAENIYPLGIPRMDMFTSQKHRWETIEKMRRQYSDVVLGKVVILFAPTYRAANKQKESEVDFIKILTDLATDLEPDKILVYKPHPYLMNESLEQLKNYDNILVAKDYTVNEWMLIADAFITDYSSAIFEFALLKKPLAHFVPDLVEYEKGRGLYYPIEKISDGEIIHEYSRLAVWINSRTKNESWDTNRMLSFNFSNVSSATKQITKHFLS